MDKGNGKIGRPRGSGRKLTDEDRERHRRIRANVELRIRLCGESMTSVAEAAGISRQAFASRLYCRGARVSITEHTIGLAAVALRCPRWALTAPDPTAAQTAPLPPAGWLDSPAVRDALRADPLPSDAEVETIVSTMFGEGGE